MRGRNYSLRTLHADATILDVSSARTKPLARRTLRVVQVSYAGGVLNN
ncbi:MAG: hypothetical protein WB781_16370 [Candidatus Sulfotelmatobacter sp.]